MANANHCIFPLCLLLLILSATATTATAAAPAPAPHRRLQKSPRLANDDQTGTPTVPLPQTVVGTPIVPLLPTVVSCWKSILASESCVDDVLQSLASLQVHISKACCLVLERIGGKCVADAFSSFPFSPTYLPLVKHVCDLTV